MPRLVLTQKEDAVTLDALKAQEKCNVTEIVQEALLIYF